LYISVQPQNDWDTIAPLEVAPRPEIDPAEH
jgi:hypothetical protein